MKHSISFTLAATGIAAMLAFTNCRKDVENANYESSGGGNSSYSSEQPTTGVAYMQTGDRLDAIVKDLSQSSYSFSFSKTNTSFGITRTAYGADNYLLFAYPQDLICPDPIKYRYRKIPIWKRPNFIVPTCPDMAIDINKLTQVQDLIKKSFPDQFAGMRQIKLLSGGGMLATDRMTKQYASLSTDRIDGITKDLNPERFIMLGAPDLYNGGFFGRNFYGFADFNSIIFRPYKANLRDILKPTLKGCFDPLILKTIRERLVSLNPSLYKTLAVTPLPQNQSRVVLSY